jgi:hypothetical protein
VTAELGSLSSVKHLAARAWGLPLPPVRPSARGGGREAGLCLLDPPLFTPLEVILLKDVPLASGEHLCRFRIEEIARLSSERY